MMSSSSKLQKSDCKNSANSVPDTACTPHTGGASSALESTQLSPPVSPSMKVNSAEPGMTVNTQSRNKPTMEEASLEMKGLSKLDIEAVAALALLRISGSSDGAELGKDTLAQEKSRATPGHPTPPNPPATPVVGRLADRDAASWKKVLLEDQHEALRPLICSPAGIYSQIPIPAGFNSLTLSKIPIHHPANGADHPSFAWATIMILSLIPGHQMCTTKLVRTILALWPNITKQATADLKFEKGKRTLSAQITKSTPVIQNLKSDVDDLIDGKQYHIARLVRQGEVIIMGPSRKTAEKSADAGSGPVANEGSASAENPGTTGEKKTPATASKKRAAKDGDSTPTETSGVTKKPATASKKRAAKDGDSTPTETSGTTKTPATASKKRAAEEDNSTPSKRQKPKAGPSAGPKKALSTAEKNAAKLRGKAESDLRERFRQEGRGRTMVDVISNTRYKTMEKSIHPRPPMLAQRIWETSGGNRVGWATVNAGFVESKVAQ